MLLDRRLLIAGLVLGLGGCAGRGAGVRLQLRPDAEAGELETLAGVTASPSGLVVRLRSNGCTTKADLAFYVGRDGSGPTIAFARKRLDACKAAPGVVALDFAYAELGLAGDGAVRVLNPVSR